jgi:hypothetical protein
VVRGSVGADDGATARPGQTLDRLSARDRLVGAQAGGICAVHVPRRAVPECDVSAGV